MIKSAIMMIPREPVLRSEILKLTNTYFSGISNWKKNRILKVAKLKFSYATKLCSFGQCVLSGFSSVLCDIWNHSAWSIYLWKILCTAALLDLIARILIKKLWRMKKNLDFADRTSFRCKKTGKKTLKIHKCITST